MVEGGVGGSRFSGCHVPAPGCELSWCEKRHLLTRKKVRPSGEQNKRFYLLQPLLPRVFTPPSPSPVCRHPSLPRPCWTYPARAHLLELLHRPALVLLLSCLTSSGVGCPRSLPRPTFLARLTLALEPDAAGQKCAVHHHLIVPVGWAVILGRVRRGLAFVVIREFVVIIRALGFPGRRRRPPTAGVRSPRLPLWGRDGVKKWSKLPRKAYNRSELTMSTSGAFSSSSTGAATLSSRRTCTDRFPGTRDLGHRSASHLAGAAPRRSPSGVLPSASRSRDHSRTLGSSPQYLETCSLHMMSA